MGGRLVADLDRHFSGLAGAVVHREMATAETMQHYLNTPDGAVYGFAPVGTLGEHSIWARARRSKASGSPRPIRPAAALPERCWAARKRRCKPCAMVDVRTKGA